MEQSKPIVSWETVLKGVEDWRSVAWLVDNMIEHKLSDLVDILKVREFKIIIKLDIAKKLRNYSQPTSTSQKTKKKNLEQEL